MKLARLPAGTRPRELAFITQDRFDKLVKQMHLGNRLTVSGSWPEVIFVANLVKVLEAFYHPYCLTWSDEPIPVPSFARQRLTPRQAWIFLSLARWFGGNQGLCYVKAVIDKCEGSFSSTFDGECFRYSGAACTHTFKLWPLLGGPLDNISDKDIVFVLTVLRWFSSPAGNNYVNACLLQVKETRKLIDHLEEFDRLKAVAEHKAAQASRQVMSEFYSTQVFPEPVRPSHGIA